MPADNSCALCEAFRDGRCCLRPPALIEGIEDTWRQPKQYPTGWCAEFKPAVVQGETEAAAAERITATASALAALLRLPDDNPETLAAALHRMVARELAWVRDRVDLDAPRNTEAILTLVEFSKPFEQLSPAGRAAAVSNMEAFLDDLHSRMGK